MLNRWLFILMLFVFASCSKQEIKQYPAQISYEYFPLNSGYWREFKITQIIIDTPSEVYDTTRFFLREEFAGWFLDAAQDSAMKIDRFYRDSFNHVWKPLGVWQAAIKGDEAQQVEENMRFVKLVFPVKQNLKWNGNKYNRLDTLNQYEYTIGSINEKLKFGSNVFDTTLTVIQKEKLSLIDKIEYVEVYAKGLGLISKKKIDIPQADTENTSLPIENRVVRGAFYYQDIIDYGQN